MATLEASVTDNWDAVAEAVRGRANELGLTQKDLAARSGVSESTIRSIMKNYRPRKRGRHTLEDLSKGLQWPAHYLARLLDESTVGNPPDVGSLQAEVASLRDLVADLASRVEALEHGGPSR
jgi:transcriptional regulator with XRE-family HTH domain